MYAPSHTRALRHTRHLFCLGACLLLTAVGCAPSSTESGKSSNAVLLPVDSDPTIAFSVWFDVGSQDDPVGKEGLAQLTADLLSEGATTENSYQEILEKLYPIASGYGVSVDREMTTIRGRTHRDNLETFFGLYTDAYLRPAFDQDDFERLRSNQRNGLEKTLRYASDEELGKAALYNAIFTGTRYAHPSLGTVQGLASITLDDVKAFYAEHFTKDNAVVALAGGFEPGLVQRFEATLDQLSSNEATTDHGHAKPTIDVAPIEGRHLILVDKPSADASISFGFPISVRRGDDDFYALWLANSWLGEHRNSSSHLYSVIREARGMNYGDYSYIETFPNGGRRQMPPTNVARNEQIFEVWIRTLPNPNAHFALRAAIRELEHLVDHGLTEEQFNLTRAFLTKYSLHFAPTSSTRLGYAIDDRFYGIEGEGHLARFRRRMSELTLDEVNAAIKKYLQYDNMKIAMVTGDATGLSQAIATDAPSPIDYGGIQKPAEILEEDKIISTYPLHIPAENITTIPIDEIFEK